jgi:hypothetical protein
MQVAQELPCARLNCVKRPVPEVPSPDLTLVVLAAGLGSRFGGDKQFAELGPAGETLMDYAVFDAARAGIERVVLVLREESLAHLPALRQRYGHRVQLDAITQKLTDLPSGTEPPIHRRRPWGTAQAILSARAAVSGPFLVVNADDFYGAGAYREMARARREDAVTWHLAGFPLAATLSPSGPVNRAVCELDARGLLFGLSEVRGITRGADDVIRGGSAAARTPFPPDATVSMNMWGLTAAAFDPLERSFADFLMSADLEADEHYLPDAVAHAMSAGHDVRVIPVPSDWCGVTYPADAPAARQHLDRLTSRGDYPSPLWP